MAANPSNPTPTYYSPTAILTDSQKAPTTFTLAVPTLTPLNNGSAIEEGTKLDLPLWLAEMLAVSKPAGPASPTSLASLDMPFALGPRVLNALKADPKSVDVRAQAPWFYGLGERMLELFEDEEVGEVLLECQLCSSAAFCIGMCSSSTYSQFGRGPHQATPADHKSILYRLSNNEPWKSQTMVLMRQNDSCSAPLTMVAMPSRNGLMFPVARREAEDPSVNPLAHGTCCGRSNDRRFSASLLPARPRVSREKGGETGARVLHYSTASLCLCWHSCLSSTVTESANREGDFIGILAISHQMVTVETDLCIHCA
ncbi:hypothetical protein KC361_g136 [Hortaea werneckii]|nr:hypothetical protein KC361_g136 [Hortaea werneckii]